jgi:hypothetical protein
MDFAFDSTTTDYRDRLLHFMDQHIIPAQPVYAVQAAERTDRWSTPPVINELKAEARKRGLWNLFLPHEPYGAGLTNLQYAPPAESWRRTGTAERGSLMRLEDILVPEVVLAAWDTSVRADLRDRRFTVDPDDAGYGAAFRYYRLLTDLPFRIADELALTEQTVLYNRYFWFARLTHLRWLGYGPDGSFEQQLFKILEGMDHAPFEIDWAVIEEIDRQARGEQPGKA